MPKPPPTPPSRDHGTEEREASAQPDTGAADEQEVSRRNAAGRPPQTKQ